MRTVSLAERQEVYRAAEAILDEVSVRWLDAKAAGPVPIRLQDEMDEALGSLLRAKRRLEVTQRRIAKATA